MKKLGSGGQGAVYLVDILSTPFTSASDTDREATACDQVYANNKLQQNFQWQMDYVEYSNASNLPNLIAAFHQEAKSSRSFHLACVQAPC
jgi:hypothetical protein